MSLNVLLLLFGFVLVSVTNGYFLSQIPLKLGNNVIKTNNIENVDKKFYEYGYDYNKVYGGQDDKIIDIADETDKLASINTNINKLKLLNILLDNSVSNLNKLNLIENNELVKFNNKIAKSNLNMGGLFDDWNK
jgi:hypothetical protein